MVWAIINCFTLLRAENLCVFFPSCIPSWECNSLKWWINQTFWWLVFFCEYKPLGQVQFDYSMVMWGLGGCKGVL